MPLDVIRYSAFFVFVAAALVAAGGWAVQTRRVNPFSSLGRTLKRVTDPVLVPVERWVVKNGGNPQNAGWWVFGGAVVGGILFVSVAEWIVGQVTMMSLTATSGRGLLRLLVLYAGRLLLLAIFVRWVGLMLGAGRYNRWMRPAYWLTDWIINPLRKVIPPIGMIDVTPFVAYVLIWVVRGVLLSRL